MELLKKLAPFFFITRPKNLLLVGLTQFIIYHYMFNKFDNELALSGNLLYIFILDTIIISASGYIINDLIDYKADAVNKPHKTYIPHSISLKNAIIYYLLLVAIGLFLCIYISIKLNNLPLVYLYLLASSILYFYSKKYKNTILKGNIIVSLYVAFVPGVTLLIEKSLIFEKIGQEYQNIILQILLFYIVFSFLINLIREIIKDMEDVDGDQRNGYMTLPIKYGIITAQRCCIALSAVTVLILVGWIILTDIKLDLRVQTYLLLFVAAPLVKIIQLLSKTNYKQDFSKISTMLKWIMLAGLGAFILISNIML